MSSSKFFQAAEFLFLLVLLTYPAEALPQSSLLRRDQRGTSWPNDHRNVQTTSGRYVGHCSLEYPNVTEYLGIRYALPPIGNLRFAAPIPFISEEVFEASRQPDDCPYVAHPWGNVTGELLSHAPRIMAQESADGYNAMSEDCLSFNIWAPSRSTAKKPVMVFVYGGGFERGSINNPGYDGANMAANEDVIVVTFNFRVNIIGFSNAPGTDNNVALRDMRLAVEWVRDNIEAFGGDVDHITLFGQSQGAYLISYYAYAYPQDPIASSFIQQSGTAFDPVAETQPIKTENWHIASAAVGCNQQSDLAILECMRAQNLSTVLAAWSALPADSTTTASFGPVIDNELIFANYKTKTLAREFAQKPFLIGSNDNEAAFYVLRYADTFPLNQTAQDEIGFGQYVCPTALDAATKAAAFAGTNMPVYRYEYMGDWPNLRLYPGSRAYHTSETSVIFGTMEELSGDPNTDMELKVSRYMQHAWTTFARDPQNGLHSLGWPRYNPNGNTLIQLGNGEDVEPSYVSPTKYDSVCARLGRV